MPGNSVSSLKVNQLKSELEKRGLEKAGMKRVLITRLTEAIVSEGLDPENYELQCDEDGNVPDETVENKTSDDEEVTQEILLSDNELMPPPNPVMLLTVEDTITMKKSLPHINSSANLSVADSLLVNVDDKEVQELSKELASDTGSDLGKDENEHNDSTENSIATETTQQNGQKKKLVAKRTGKSTDAKLVWISNVSTEIKAADLKALFSSCGKVVASRIVTLKGNGTSEVLYGHLEMASPTDASAAIQKFNGTELKGQVLYVGNNLVSVKRSLANATKESNAQPNSATKSDSEMKKDEELEKHVASTQPSETEKSTSVNPIEPSELSERLKQLKDEEERIRLMRREVFMEKLQVQREKQDLKYQLKRASITPHASPRKEMKGSAPSSARKVPPVSAGVAPIIRRRPLVAPIGNSPSTKMPPNSRGYGGGYKGTMSSRTYSAVKRPAPGPSSYVARKFTRLARETKDEMARELVPSSSRRSPVEAPRPPRREAPPRLEPNVSSTAWPSRTATRLPSPPPQREYARPAPRPTYAGMGETHASTARSSYPGQSSSSSYRDKAPRHTVGETFHPPQHPPRRTAYGETGPTYFNKSTAMTSSSSRGSAREPERMTSSYHPRGGSTMAPSNMSGQRSGYRDYPESAAAANRRYPESTSQRAVANPSRYTSSATSSSSGHGRSDPYYGSGGSRGAAMYPRGSASASMSRRSDPSLSARDSGEYPTTRFYTAGTRYRR